MDHGAPEPEHAADGHHHADAALTALDEAAASRLAETALGHVTREYPNHLSHAVAGAGDVATPRALHPVFYGSYDWHSCVHAYWMLAHLLHRFPGFAPAARIAALFDAQLTADGIAAECAYFARPGAPGFERPYGWAWVLKLAEALRCLPQPAWSQAVSPLSDMLAARLEHHLTRSPYPVRVGTHFNTAFALALAADYAGPALLDTLRLTARRWYGADVACQAWEPGADDFLSSALIEAECMRRLLPAEEFGPWFTAFLPGLAQGEPATLFTPPVVVDRTDGKTAHLDGLCLTRAWCLRSLAATLPEGDQRLAPMDAAVHAHLAAALPHVTGHYAGEHWLATFAVLALG